MLAVVVMRIWPLRASALCQTRTVPDPTHPTVRSTRSSTCTWAARWRYARPSASTDSDALSLAYTPGVARVCEAIAADPALTRHYTWVPNTVAVVTDGTAVLGLGDIGPAAAMPVMEGKAVLFKQFGGVDAVPICLATTDVEEIIETVVRLAPSFGGINLEDISAPRCFEIEDRLKERLDIPVFHDDQHGTAVVALAALTNALRLTGRNPESTRVVISGAGAAGVAVAKILLEAGIKDLAVTDRKGVLHSSRGDLTPVKRALAAMTADQTGRTGALADVLAGADVYIGVSGGTVPEEYVATMAPESIVFGLANPNPEVHPDVGAQVRTGRGHRSLRLPQPDQQRARLPGIFRVPSTPRDRDHRGHEAAAAIALAELVGDDLAEDLIVPSPFDPAWARGGDRGGRGRARDGVARPELSDAVGASVDSAAAIASS